MLRKFLPVIVLLLSACALTANAQFSGGGTSLQGVDCSNPITAISPACAAASTNPSLGVQQPGDNAGQGGSGQSASGQSAYGASGNRGSAQTPNPAANGGINNRVPMYNDQLMYGNGMNGARRNGGSMAETPPPPTSFQRVVAGATGAMLPIFGADLFFDSSTSFAPIDRTPVTPDYVVGPGDQLLVRIWGQVNLDAHVTVDRAGDIYIPQAGNIPVAGLHFEQLDGYLKSQLGRVFRNFDLSVNMGQLRSIQIYVVGDARRPGSYTLSSLSTLVNALFSSGGPSEQGSMRRIQLKRGGKIVTTFDLYDLLINGDKSHDAPLLPGDVIYIPPVGPQVAVAGSVHVPAIYELKGTETAGQVIAMAGGLSTLASRQGAQLDRTNHQGTRETVQVDLDAAGLQTPMRDGDILRVPAMVQRFQDTVTLRGNVANPGRYRWFPGMHILDLIPDEASVETRGYWQRRIALGLPALEYTPLFSAYHATLPNPTTQAVEVNAAPKTYSTGTPLAASESQSASQPAASTAQKAAAQSSSAPPATDNQTARYQENASGEQLQYYPPGERFSQNQFPIRNEILRTAPTIDWSYAAIERTNPHTLAPSIIPFSLGQAVLDHNMSQNPALEPGDVVTVFSTADIHVPQSQQVKFVSIQGEVVHAGIYSVGPHETLRDVVRRAGGLTPHAYLYGSEFLRQSTQRIQQARLEQYVNSLEKDIQLASANAAGSLVNPIGAAALGTSLQSQHELIASLRQLRATGRIVLNLTPYSHGIDALPDLTLQDGDRFIVPVTPVTVNVVGAVYDENSFLYRRGDHVGDYLRISGGGTRNADKRHEFVIRADGSVISKQTAGSSLFGRGFKSKLSYPGDTVVVPDNVTKTTLLRNLTDYSAVLSNFGVGVAAINLLK